MIVMAVVGVTLVGGLVSAALLFVLSLIGPRLTWPLVSAAVVLGLAVAALWVRPWDLQPPSRPQ